jgi:hypothetical protein
MSYIGVSPSTAAFPFDQFSGNGTTTAFTMSYAPASTTSMVVSISGVVQNPNTYGISGLTLTFSAAPPTGTNNIAVLYLGIPATSVTTPGNSAYLSSTEFTATAGQTTFTPSGSYQVGFINVIRNGAQLAPSDYTATNGTTVVLGSACAVGDAVVIEVYNLVSVANALPSTGGTVTGATTFNSTVSINGANGSGYTGYKNRIINGGMVIDQRNNGGVVTYPGGGSVGSELYGIDRWAGNSTGSTRFSMQRSTVAPAGFVNSFLITTTTAGTPAAGDFCYFVQYIEGFNCADLAFGTASAATITISFWVRSSLTGTFGGSVANSAGNRRYPFSFVINSANTYEQKTITIAGDTTGTWLTDNGRGLGVFFNLGTGSSNKGTANAWATSGIAPTGTVDLVSTAGATLYITGVQLERGSNATSFEFRDYGRELMMCQRYFQEYLSTNGAIFRANGSTGQKYYWMPFSTAMRVNATMTVGTPTYYNMSAASWANSGQDGSEIFVTASGADGYVFVPWTASAEL